MFDPNGRPVQIVHAGQDTPLMPAHGFRAAPPVFTTEVLRDYRPPVPTRASRRAPHSHLPLYGDLLPRLASYVDGNSIRCGHRVGELCRAPSLLPMPRTSWASPGCPDDAALIDHILARRLNGYRADFRSAVLTLQRYQLLKHPALDLELLVELLELLFPFDLSMSRWISSIVAIPDHARTAVARTSPHALRSTIAALT